MREYSLLLHKKLVLKIGPVSTIILFLFHLALQLTYSQTSPGFYVSAIQIFENTVGKGEIAPFPIVFYLLGELSTMFIKLQNVVCRFFQFRRV